jgi:hypothetical protein
MNEQPILPGMPTAQPQADAGLPPIPEAGGDSTGFSTPEKLIAAAAVYRAPIASSLAASAMLRDETDPTRRRQLTTMRNLSLIWWGVGAVGAIIGLVVVLSFANFHGAGPGGGCRGERDQYAVEDITYQSSDGKHWTGTYPCTEGGSTTIAVARSEVPVEGR